MNTKRTLAHTAELLTNLVANLKATFPVTRSSARLSTLPAKVPATLATKSTLTLLTILVTTLLSINAKADGIQVCVDSKGSTYTAKISGFATPDTEWSGIIASDSKSAIANGTDLNHIIFKGNLADSHAANIEDMSFTLKRLVAPTVESLQEGADISYNDEPRVYESNGVDLICTSTMSEDEYASLAK
jgi:hypothetical protein